MGKLVPWDAPAEPGAPRAPFPGARAPRTKPAMPSTGTCPHSLGASRATDFPFAALSAALAIHQLVQNRLPALGDLFRRLHRLRTTLPRVIPRHRNRLQPHESCRRFGVEG